MAARVASKIKLTSVDELLGVPENADGAVYILASKISAFTNHPFKVVDDEKMTELVESIKVNGILNPVIVRPAEMGTYEMISGHRRLHAARIAGLEKVPAIVREMDDDTAVLAMVDANIQREEILPSERAFAFKMKKDALNHKGQRTDLVTSRHDVAKLSAEVIGKESGIDKRTVERYIRLTYLIPELLEMVDAKKLNFVIAVDISFFDKSVQTWIYEYIKENGFIKAEQVAALKKQKNLENMTQYVVISVMNSALPEKKASGKVTFSEKKLDKYFPSHYSAWKREQIILELLEKWSLEQQNEVDKEGE